ncbi:hypothetical protein LP238_00410 [Companilactobacillus paralimentarius]|nr:hypothetical protein LP238_00410 [Companilactobacillus paralimentarius]
MDKGGCVRYSTGSGSPWKFSAPEFRKFVLEHKKEFANRRKFKCLIQKNTRNKEN